MSVGLINSSSTQLPLFAAVRTLLRGLSSGQSKRRIRRRILVERGADFHGLYLV
jgi:hypothetical protein